MKFSVNLIVLGVLLLVVLTAAFASQDASQQPPEKNADDNVTALPAGADDASRDSRGPGSVVGTTWWESQHYGSMGRMVDWGWEASTGTFVHFSWMKRPDQYGPDRYYAYNCYDATAATYLGETAVHPPYEIGGYVGIDVTNDNRAAIGGHVDEGSGEHPRFHWDFQPGVGFFSPYTSSIPDAVIWPKFRYQELAGGDVTHVLAIEDNGSLPPLPGNTLYYYRKVGTDNAGTWETAVTIDNVSVVGHDIACSNTTGKVALVWIAPVSGALVPSWDSDIHYMISNDQGVTWSPEVNLTNNVVGQAGYRPFTDLSVLIDSDDDLHIGWNGRVWPGSIPTGYSAGRCRMFHWSELLPFIRTVANLEWTQTHCDGGAWQMNGSKMSVSECEGKLYYLWVQFNDIPNGINDDCAARGGPGAANGELFISVSWDNGLTWDPARNLTYTYTPDCDSASGSGGACGSEHWPSMARFGFEDYTGDWSGAELVDPSWGMYSGDYYLDVQYIEDPDAGDYYEGEGTQQEAEVKWFRMACVDPVPDPVISVDPSFIDEYVEHGVEVPVPLIIENTGNVSLNYTLYVTEYSGPAGWLGTSGGSGSVPAGLNNTETIDVFLNLGGMINNPPNPVYCSGEIQIVSNAPTSPTIIPVDMVVTSDDDMDIQITQMHWRDTSGTVVTANSDWGKASYTVNPRTDGVVEYLCISAIHGSDTGWIVRNCPIYPYNFVDTGRFALEFDFNEIGVSSGTNVTSLEIASSVTTDLQVSGPMDDFVTIAVGTTFVQSFGSIYPYGGPGPYEGPQELSPMYYTSVVDTDSLIKYKNMPSVQEGNSECASGSTARSLKWLSDRHGLGLPSVEEIQDSLALAKYMNSGVTDEEQVKAKKKYIDDNGLPLEVHYWYSEFMYPTGMNTPGITAEGSSSISMLDYIWRELKKGQDIEITLQWWQSWGHSITVVGLDKKNGTLEYRDDEDQGDDTSGDSEIKDADLVALGYCVVGPDSYLTTKERCEDVLGGVWQGYNGEYGFRSRLNIIKSVMCESPTDLGTGFWRYHPRYVDGWLTVWGTINCETYGSPLFDRDYVNACHRYYGEIPWWANDYLAIFEWDYWCGNVDSVKVAVPYFDWEFGWRLRNLGNWITEVLPGPDSLVMPVMGDSSGSIQNVFTLINPDEWTANPQPIQEDYVVVEGVCPDLPGYIFGTTPFEFHPDAGSGGNPFSTTPLTGLLTWDGEVTFLSEEITEWICGDINGDTVGPNIADLVYLVAYLFSGGDPPPVMDAANVNNSGEVNIADLVYLVAYLFTGGPDPDCG